MASRSSIRGNEDLAYGGEDQRSARSNPQRSAPKSRGNREAETPDSVGQKHVQTLVQTHLVNPSMHYYSRAKNQ